ncbi:MAG: sugar-binding domain-containing protein [Halapricum sp.]
MNDQWTFRIDPESNGNKDEWYDPATDWDDTRTVSVPHSWQEHEDLRTYTGTAWYRTTFTFDSLEDGQQALLSFGAVDYETTVWVNGQRVGEHRGGYLPFTVDATTAIEPGENTVAIRVHDPEDISEIPHGKQGAEWYTRVSGPWQGIDLVVVPEVRVNDLRVTPDLDSGTADVAISVSRDTRSFTATVRISRDGSVVSETSATVQDGTVEESVSIPDPDYWTPETPDLYDIEVTLSDGEDALDSYETYFGMRSVAYDDGQLYLNGEPFEMRGALDQAFYPDTYYRPADIETFEEEIRAAKELGFNLLRKHIKPAHPEFVELADRLGILVWEEPANPDRYTDRSKGELREQLFGMIDRDYNNPSVIAWSIYNEEWGIGYHEKEASLWEDPEKQDYLESLYHDVREYDPTRLVCDNSGWAHVATDLNDYHEYFVVPDRRDAWRDRLEEITSNPSDNYGDVRTDPDEAPLLVSEFGTWGLGDIEALYDHYDGTPHWFEHDFLSGLKRPGDPKAKFEASPASSVFDSLSELATAWQRREFQSVESIIADMRVEDDVAGYVITELSDIEWEFNGLLDYLRSEKAFYESFARVNAPMMVHLEPSTHTAWSGDEIDVDLVLANDRSSKQSLSVTLSAAGAETTVDVTVPSHDTVRVKEAMTFVAPDVAELSPVDITAVSSNVERSVTRAVYVAPDDRRSERIAVYTDNDALATALVSRGYEVLDDPDTAAVSVVTDPTGVSGPALVLPEADGYLTDTDRFEYRELPERESWNLCASFVYQDLFETVDVTPGWAFEDLYPYGYVTNVSTRDDVLVGYTEGWLENGGAITAVQSTHDGDIGVCTLRVTDVYGEHPVGTAVVDELLSRLK